MMSRWLLVLLCSSCVIDTVPLPEELPGDHDLGGGGDTNPPSYSGDQGLDPSPDLCLGDIGGADTDLTRFRFEQRDPYLAVSILRRYVEIGVGESVIYSLEEMRIYDGSCTVVSAPTALEYANSHHNWHDRAIATYAGVRYELAMDFDLSSWTVSVTATQEGSGTFLFDGTLITTGGPLFCWNCPNHLPIMINEVGANNVSILADSEGDYDSWIEIFNPSSGDINLEGFALSNDSDPLKWQFPAGTIIARHEYLVVWADGQSGLPLHTNFTLANGGVLRLSAANTTSGGERRLPTVAADTTAIYDWSTDGYSAAATPTPGAANPDI